MNLLAPGRNLVLIGMPGSGKTSVGRLLAARLDRPFADTDEMVEAETGMRIADLIVERGERAFREVESAQVRRVAALRGQVVAVGGGAVVDPSSATQLRGTGDLVLLDAEPAQLADRLQGEGAVARPLLAGDDLVARLDELRRRRADAYARAATVAVETGGATPDEVADLVLEWAAAKPGLLRREELPA